MTTSTTRNAIATRPGALLAPQTDYILVDGSSSMLDKWWDFMSSLDAFVDQLRTAQLNSHVICQVFDSYNLSMIQRDCLLHDCPTFHDAPLESTWGMTPLRDAIHSMGLALRDLDPARASVVVVTDGDDTGSKLSWDQAKSILDWMKAKGWAVTFIGCDYNNTLQASRLGITDANSIGVAKAMLTDAAKNFAEKRKRHYHTGEDIRFTDDEKQQFGGYLTGPSR